MYVVPCRSEKTKFVSPMSSALTRLFSPVEQSKSSPQSKSCRVATAAVDRRTFSEKNMWISKDPESRVTTSLCMGIVASTRGLVDAVVVAKDQAVSSWLVSSWGRALPAASRKTPKLLVRMVYVKPARKSSSTRPNSAACPAPRSANAGVSDTTNVPVTAVPPVPDTAAGVAGVGHRSPKNCPWYGENTAKFSWITIGAVSTATATVWVSPPPPVARPVK
mmetsp:Transcript_42525/g.112114  ORF Transcript_42525/g.112114 Transcript_42525/m.112114 type:complete len:220 (-) Transcript_42525:1273-1932(-)